MKYQNVMLIVYYQITNYQDILFMHRFALDHHITADVMIVSG